jgi:hypothetical protein
MGFDDVLPPIPAAFERRPRRNAGPATPARRSQTIGDRSVLKIATCRRI